ncbi:MAG: amidohydrolase [Proteobacteria bacterium]|nr:amidohydrolase [Pseudomonadota bacterium]
MPTSRISDTNTRLPIKIDSTSNGEFEPIPLEPAHEHANRTALETAERNSRRLNLTRRQFLVSSTGAAATLLALNSAYAMTGNRGGYFELDPEAGLDKDAADNVLEKKEFIFDVQGHFVNPTGAWLKHKPPGSKPLRGTPQAGCALADKPGERSYLQCLGPDQFLKDVFMDSDTDMMVLSFVPSTHEEEPLTIEEAAATQEIVAKMDGSHRLLVHGRVNPNQEGDIARMDELAGKWKVSAFKTYTQWGPDGKGFFLDDDVGIAFIEKARELGVRNIAIHKGLPFGRQSYEHSLCDDVGRVAKKFSDMNFLIYHSGFVAGHPEREFDPKRNEGIDSLIKSVVENDVAENTNVYAELGSTWRYLMRDPDSAAHSLGKLFKYIGEDNVLWGTDSIWYGSPQDQIQAFRTFQISPELRERFGYPAMTPKLRAKVFGLNAMKPYNISAEEMQKRMAGDRVAQERLAYADNPDPHFRTYGPKTRREFLNLLANGGG